MRRRRWVISSDAETDSNVEDILPGPPTPQSRPSTPDLSAPISYSTSASPTFATTPLARDDALFNPHTPSPKPHVLRKRTMDEARSASMPPSPEKKKPRVEAQSAIRSAIEMNDEGGSGGLMRFFKPCTKAE